MAGRLFHWLLVAADTVTSSSPVYLQLRTSMVVASEVLSNLFDCPEEKKKAMQGCVAANHHQISKRLHSIEQSREGHIRQEAQRLDHSLILAGFLLQPADRPHCGFG